jgi:F420-dependent oxidoreductase-like protein
MAQQAATAGAMSGGRFRLGVGPSHVAVMKMYGIDFDRPISHLSEYLTIVKGLLNEGSVKLKGERYSVMGFLDVEGGGGVPVLLAALHEQMCRLAGRQADGVLPWLAPVSYVAEVIVPQVRAGAEAAGRPAPPVIAEVPCVLTSDIDVVRKIAATELAMYTQVPFYVDMLTRAGVVGAADAPTSGWSDAMIDAALPWGDEDALATRAQAYLDAGADEVVFSPFGGGDEMVEVLGDIARG